MERYINKVLRIFKKKYFVIVFLFVCAVSLLGATYSYWAIESGWNLASELKFKELNYLLHINDESVNTIVSPANSGTVYYNVKITSLNDINTRYSLTYKSTASGLAVEVASSSENDSDGIIGLYEVAGENIKIIKIAVTNNTANDSNVELSVVGGYTWNPESEIDLPTGFSRISGIHEEELLGQGLTLAEELNILMGCTPTSESACLVKENTSNYLTYSNKTWRIVGTYLIDDEYITKVILDEPLTTKVTSANVSSELTSFYSTLDTSLIRTSSPFTCTGTTDIACTGSANIGLLSKAEYDKIGGVNSYLYTKPNKEYWLNDTYYMGTSRGIINGDTSSLAYIRPVIYLKNETVETTKTSNEVEVTNLVTNGSFENGSTGWSTTFPTINNTVTQSVSNGALYINDTSTTNGFWNYQPISFVGGHEYYISYKANVVSLTTGYPYFCIKTSSASVNNPLNHDSITDGFENFSFKFVANVDDTHIQLGDGIAYVATIYFDDISVYDLTEAFGAGNEPSKAWCDANLSYFDGTDTIEIKSGLAGTSSNPYVAQKGVYLTVNLNGGVSNIKNGYYASGETYQITKLVKEDSALNNWTVSGTGASANSTSFTMGSTATTLIANWIFGYKEFAYTGNYREWTVPNTGWYEIEAWGAEGGRYNTTLGGKGGYTSGKIYLTRGETIYVYVGGTTATTTGGYNGGGNATAVTTYGGGGGATDIRINSTSMNDRIMVAAGGAGSGYYAGGSATLIGGSGGGLIGNTGTGGGGGTAHTLATGGTQTSGGLAINAGTSSDYIGTFGLGGSLQPSVGSNYGTGGGGGYYGGARGSATSSYVSAGAGGSSFMSGYAGSNAIFDTVDLSNVRYIKDCMNGNPVDTDNHWAEIQAIVGTTNVALNKTVIGPTPNTHASSPGTWQVITDGSSSTTSYAYGTTYDGYQCVIVDLAQEYDLDEIKVWHYWSDGRTYNDNVTYVASTNTANTNWKPVKATTEAETSAGKSAIDGTVNSSNPRLHTNNTLHYSGKYFIDGEMLPGNNSGNGKAKVTWIGTSLPKTNTKLNNVRYIKDCKNGNSSNTANHWVEIQALIGGVNVALNKVVTTSAPYMSSVSNQKDPTSIVDGGIDTNSITVLPEGYQCVLIDLEQEYDLDEIAVWNYKDKSEATGRTFYSNTTYVASTNTASTTWIPVIATEEPETSQGKRVNAWDSNTAVIPIYKVANLVANSGFESGATGIENIGTNNSISSTISYSGTNSLYSSTAARWAGVKMNFDYSNITLGDIMYLSEMINVTEYAADTVYMYSGVSNGSGNDNVIVTKNSLTNGWERITKRGTIIYEPTAGYAYTLFVNYAHKSVSSATINSSYVDNILLINLTKTFGAGNEPDITWCNANLNYFDGTQTLHLSP